MVRRGDGTRFPRGPGLELLKRLIELALHAVQVADHSVRLNVGRIEFDGFHQGPFGLGRVAGVHDWADAHMHPFFCL